MERPGTPQPQQETDQDQSDRGRQENTGLEGMRSPLASGETNVNQGHDSPAERGRLGIKDQKKAKRDRRETKVVTRGTLFS